MCVCVQLRVYGCVRTCFPGAVVNGTKMCLHAVEYVFLQQSTATLFTGYLCCKLTAAETAYTHTNTHIHTSTHAHTHTRTHTHTHTQTHTHTRTNTHARTHAHTHTHAYTRTHAHKSYILLACTIQSSRGSSRRQCVGTFQPLP